MTLSHFLIVFVVAVAIAELFNLLYLYDVAKSIDARNQIQIEETFQTFLNFTGIVILIIVVLILILFVQIFNEENFQQKK